MTRGGEIVQITRIKPRGLETGYPIHAESKRMTMTYTSKGVRFPGKEDSSDLMRLAPDLPQPKTDQESLNEIVKGLEAADTSANANQVGGTHYKSKAIQPWDYVASNGLGFFEGNVVKYLTRWRDKGGVADLRKAQHYIQKLIEVESAKEGGAQ